jgi:hypothetical protein
VVNSKAAITTNRIASQIKWRRKWVTITFSSFLIPLKLFQVTNVEQWFI